MPHNGTMILMFSDAKIFGKIQMVSIERQQMLVGKSNMEIFDHYLPVSQ